MNLAQSVKHKTYNVTKILNSDEEIMKRYFQLGVFPGAQIVLKRKAPLFLDPLIFQVDESQIVLTKFEASLVEVEEAIHHA
jgi:Fe2+ transport system protein FeoA